MPETSQPASSALGGRVPRIHRQLLRRGSRASAQSFASSLVSAGSYGPKPALPRQTQPCTTRPALSPFPGLSESRRIARQRLAIRDSVKMSASAIRRFGDSVIPRIRGCQSDRAGPGRAQRQSYAAQATQATHLHYPKQTS